MKVELNLIAYSQFDLTNVNRPWLPQKSTWRTRAELVFMAFHETIWWTLAEWALSPNLLVKVADIVFITTTLAKESKVELLTKHPNNSSISWLPQKTTWRTQAEIGFAAVEFGRPKWIDFLSKLNWQIQFAVCLIGLCTKPTWRIGAEPVLSVTVTNRNHIPCSFH